MEFVKTPDTRRGKMSHYQHLTTSERAKASVLRQQGFTITTIAAIVKRNKSTISRELRRNKREGAAYVPEKATEMYQKRRRACHAQPKLKTDEELRQRIIEKLEQRWTPEQIVERAKKEGKALGVSYNTIYRAVDSGIIPKETRQFMRFKHRYKRHKAKTEDKRGKMVGVPTIAERPRVASNRRRRGDWESDTVLGTRRDGQGIGTHVDRKSGFLIAFKLEGLTAEEYTRKTIETFSSLPASLRHTFTVDRGTEFKLYQQLSIALEADFFFCDPYCSWQKGTVENTNGLLRQFYPKGSPFNVISPQDLAAVVRLINLRPRKRLGWKTPAEVFLRKSLHFT